MKYMTQFRKDIPHHLHQHEMSELTLESNIWQSDIYYDLTLCSVISTLICLYSHRRLHLAEMTAV